MMKYNYVVFLGVVLVACSKTADQCVQKSQNEGITETHLRRVWLSGLCSILSEEMDGEKLTKEQITRVIVEGVATEASFKYAGEEIDIKNSLIVLQRLYSNGVVPEEFLDDPLMHEAYFQRNPEIPSPVYYTHPSVLKSQKDYADFCVWFSRLIKEKE